MTTSHQITFLNPADVIIKRDERQRRDIDVSDLLTSIKKRGVINPITLNAQGELIAGERRLEACRQLGIQVPTRQFEELSPLEQQLIELEENLKRKELPWLDQINAFARIHSLYRLEDPEWTIGETADSIGVSVGTASMWLTVQGEIVDKSSSIGAGLASADKVREAYNTILRRRNREAGNELEELLALPESVSESEELAIAVQEHVASGKVLPPRPSIMEPAKPEIPQGVDECILTKSFLEWAPQYRGPKFNLIHCDFPYGANMFAGPMGRGAEAEEGYVDEKEIYFQLLQEFCTSFENFASHSCHVVFWFSFPLYEATRAMFRNHLPSLEQVRHPLIWHKTDNSGIMGDSQRDPRHTHEMALLFRRGARPLVAVRGDTYGAPTDRTLHPSTKPEPMLRFFFEMLCDEHTSLLDPTCGSGASLRAAETLKAKRVLGLEIDRGYAASARSALILTRQKMAAAEKLKEL